MKKLLSFVLILMVCCSSALLFAGCDRNTTFLFVEYTSGTTQYVDGLTDNQGRAICNIQFQQYEGPEIDRREVERTVLGDLTVFVFATAEDAKLDAKGVATGEQYVGGPMTVTALLEQGGTIANFSLKTKTSAPKTATISYQGAIVTFQYVVN